MFKHIRSSSITQTLTGASYSLTVPAKRRGLWTILLFALVFCGAVYAFRPSSISSELILRNSVAELKQQNQILAQDLKQQSMNFQHEQATREALERQLASQSEELKKVRKDLSFYRENTVR